MLALPSTNGFSVQWETGKFMKIRGVEKPCHDSYETTSRERAEQKAKEMELAGFRNVKIYECIF